MHLGLVVPNRGPAAVENVRTLPPHFESLGFHSVWFTDHVVGVRSFEPVYGPEWAEACSALAFAAATTSKIRLGLGVLVLPYREPVMAAKIISTVDGLSGGRVDIGVGTGWAKSEFYAVGRGDLFEARGRYTDEALDVILRCFEGGEFGWDGEWTEFRRMSFEPRPIQTPHPPLWIGGNAGAALRRAARLADVWHPTRLVPSEVAEGGAQLDQLAGRAVPRSVRLRVQPEMSVPELTDLLAEYEEVGCVEVVMELHTESNAEVQDWAAALAAATGLA